MGATQSRPPFSSASGLGLIHFALLGFVINHLVVLPFTIFGEQWRAGWGKTRLMLPYMIAY